MAIIIEIFIAMVFVASGGWMFRHKLADHKILGLCIAVITILSTYYVGREFSRDISEFIYEDEPNAATPEVPEFNTQNTCGGEYFSVRKNEELCGFYLSDEGAIRFEGNFVSDPIVVTYEEKSDGSRTEFMASSIAVYPSSKDGRKFFIQACEAVTEENGTPLCWSSWLFNANTSSQRQIQAGKYGALPKIEWSPDDRLLALFSKSDGIDQLHIFDSESNDVWRYPDWGGNANNNILLRIDHKTFAWTGQRQFKFRGSTCIVNQLADTCNIDTLYRQPMSEMTLFIGPYSIEQTL